MMNPQMMGNITSTGSKAAHGIASAVKGIPGLNTLTDWSAQLTDSLGGQGGAPALNQAPFSAEQVQQSLARSQAAQDQQAAFAQQLAAQNGIGNQSNVFNQLQGVASGQGPNPAMAALNNATGQNVANQAALMASQRGAGSNAGLIARQAAQQGGNLQQQAAGQGALMQAEQSLGALGQMGGLATNQVSQQGNALSNYNNAIQNQQNAMLGANTNLQTNVNNIQGAQGLQSQRLGSEAMGGLLNGVGGAVGNLFKPTASNPGGSGGAPPMPVAGNYAHGGEVGPQSFLAKHFHGIPIEAAHGHVVQGHAQVHGDSPKNDTVPAMLSPGEIVIPRSHSHDPELAAEFARSIVMKNRGKR